MMNKPTLLFATVLASLSCITGCATKKVLDSKQDLVAQLLQNRFSGRSYDATRTVSQAQLDMLVHAAQTTPSSYNMQPWNFIICDRATHADGYAKIFDSLVEFNQGWAKDAPVLIAVVASKLSPHNKQPNAHAQYDTGAAAFAMMMQAASLGLMAHQMAGFDAEAIRASFQIPSEFEPMAVMAVGYSLETRAPKKERKPIAENFFFGEWKAAG
jgi:nitroreductase